MVFSGDFPGRGFCYWPLNGVPGAPFQGTKRHEGHPPALKIKVVMSHAQWPQNEGNGTIAKTDPNYTKMG